MSSTLDEYLKKHRRRIIAREEAAMRELLAAYRDLQKNLKKQYAEIQQLMIDAQNDGVEIRQVWVMRSRRLKAMLDQVNDEVVRFGGRAARIVEREQAAAIRIAAEQTEDMIRVLAGANSSTIGSMLSTRAVETAVGMVGKGSPLMAYFEKNLAPAVTEKLRSEIVRAAALGTDSRTIARRLTEAGDITRQRALSTARTEVNRVRRSATLERYRESPDIFSGWEWVASMSERTCPACLAMDGRIFKLKDEFPQHINCRCTMIPVIKGVPRPPRQTGSEWFEEQPDDVKERILGKSTFEAYKRGEVEMKDMVGWATSKEFGKRVYTKKLATVLSGKEITLGMPNVLAKSIKYADFDEFKPNALHGQRFNEKVAAILLNDPVARRVYQRINDAGADIIFDGIKTDGQILGTTGKNGPTRLSVRIYLSATQTPERTVSTIIHEYRHVKRWAKNKSVATQQEEIMANMLEFVYYNKRRPRKDERDAIRRMVRDLYWDAPK